MKFAKNVLPIYFICELVAHVNLLPSFLSFSLADKGICASFIQYHLNYIELLRCSVELLTLVGSMGNETPYGPKKELNGISQLLVLVRN
jgi:hypothetical protein